MAGNPRDFFTVAVLPLQNVTGNPAHEFLSEGIAETIATQLSNAGHLKVVERLQIDKLIQELKFSQSDYADQRTALKMGKMMSAAYVIIGSYQITGGKVLINERVVNVESSATLKGFNITGSKDDVFGLQLALAEKLAGGIFAARGIKEYTWARRTEKLGMKSFKKLERARTIVEALPRHDLSPMRFKNQSTYLQGIDYLEEVLEESSNNLLAHVYCGILYQNLDDMQKSLYYFQAAERLAPGEAEVLFYLGLYHSLSRNYQEAVRYFGKALQANPSHADSHYGLAKAYNRLRDKERAIYHAFKAMEYGPGFIDGRRFLGSLLRGNVGGTTAVRYYSSKLSSSPSDSLANIVIGVTEAERGNLGGAYPRFRQALSGFPSMAEAYYYMGAALAKSRQLNEAVPLLKQALQIHPSYPQANLELARASHALNRPSDALVHYQNYITFSSDASLFSKVRGWMRDCQSRLGRSNR